MKKYISVILVLSIFMGLGSCKKQDNAPKFPAPAWTVDTAGKYPLSMTAIVRVPVNITPKVSETDKIGAFFDNECRGVGTFIETGTTPVFFIMIHGTAADQSKKVNFKYFSSQNSYLYSTDAFLNFTVDGNYGTVDDPEVLDMKQVR